MGGFYKVEEALTITITIYWNYMESFKPKWVNSILDISGVNSLRLGGLHIIRRMIKFNIGL